MALSLFDFEKREKRPVEWIIPNLLPRRNTAFMMGPPKKATKSWLLLAAAWDLSEGLAPWGIPALKPPQPMRTVYFAQEDSEDNADDRVKAHLLRGGRKANDRLWVVPKNLNLALDSKEGCQLVQNELCGVYEATGRGEIDLVVFDPMRRIHRGDENDSTVIARLWAVIDDIHQKYGCAVLISHHVRKPPNAKDLDGGYDASDPFIGRGSGDIYGGGDAFVMVAPGKLATDGMSRRVTLHFESKREAQLPAASLRVDFRTGQVEYLNNLGVDTEEGI